MLAISRAATKGRHASAIVLIALATVACIKFDSAGVIAVRNLSGAPLQVILDYNNDGEGYDARIRPGGTETVTNVECGGGTLIFERPDGSTFATKQLVEVCPGDKFSIDSRGRITRFD